MLNFSLGKIGQLSEKDPGYGQDVHSWDKTRFSDFFG